MDSVDELHFGGHKHKVSFTTPVTFYTYAFHTRKVYPLYPLRIIAINKVEFGRGYNHEERL